jgi:hypothetical protein
MPRYFAGYSRCKGLLSGGAACHRGADLGHYPGVLAGQLPQLAVSGQGLACGAPFGQGWANAACQVAGRRSEQCQGRKSDRPQRDPRHQQMAIGPSVDHLVSNHQRVAALVAATTDSKRSTPGWLVGNSVWTKLVMALSLGVKGFRWHFNGLLCKAQFDTRVYSSVMQL